MRSKRKKRTTFSSEQKNKLIRFAESVGWKPRKEKKDEIESFCSEMGITRRMFVVWLSNNRHRAINNA
ncbi:ZF-HD homeobox protein [Glycine soja]|nr:ZF-HD homeobox protein [Glycine soja]